MSRRGVFFVSLLFFAGTTACAAQTFQVTNGNVSGPGSLQQAFDDANASGMPATIDLNANNVTLLRPLQTVNSGQLISTGGNAQVNLTSAGGYSDLLSFVTSPTAFTIGSGVTLSSYTTAVYVNTNNSSLTVNGTIIPGGTGYGVQIAENANIIVGATGSIHANATSILKLGGNDDLIQVSIAPGGAVVSDTQPAIAIQVGGLYLTVGGLLSGPRAVATSNGPNTLELHSGFQISGDVFMSNGHLVFGGTGPASFDASQIAPISSSSGQYQGFILVSKEGASTWNLTGTSTTAIPFEVNAGVLSVTGNLASASSLTVNNGGTLTGSGIVGTTVINAGGVLAPAAPGPALTVNGSLTFNPGAIYLVQASPTNAVRTDVTGTASLGGATVNAFFQPGTYLSNQYRILTAAGGVSGTFAPTVVSTNLPSGFAASLGYDANDVFLHLLAKLGAGSHLAANQQNVASTLNTYFNDGGVLSPGLLALFRSAGSNLSNFLSQAAGEAGTGSQQTTFDAMNLFLQTVFDHAGDAGDAGDPSQRSVAMPNSNEGNDAYAAEAKRSSAGRDAFASLYSKAPLRQSYDPRWSVWAASFGASQVTDGNAALGTNTATARVFGVAVGADYLLSPRTIAGFALAGGGTNFSIANGLGSGRSDLFQAGAFVRHNVGPAYFSAALAYGWQDVTTDRAVTIAGIDSLRAQFNANAYSGRVESGYRFLAPWLGAIGLTPYAAGQFTTYDLPAYAERPIVGSNTFALAYSARSTTDSRSELGLRSDRSFALPTGVLTVRSRAAWSHDFNPDRAVGANFLTLHGAFFVANGAGQADDSALVTAAIEMKWLNGWAAAGTFEGEFSSVTSSYAGKATVRKIW